MQLMQPGFPSHTSCPKLSVKVDALGRVHNQYELVYALDAKHYNL